MGFLYIPVLLGVIYAPAHADKSQLDDFGRFSQAIGHQISMIDRDGTVHEGIVRAASSTAVTMQLGSTYKTFQRSVIASAERVGDSSIGGAVRGAIFGLLYGALASQGARDDREANRLMLVSTALCSGIGYALDASQASRQALYKTNLSQAPLRVSLRF